MKDLARRLRKQQTDAERVLWHRLRNRQLNGFRFRRQHVVGPYIVDFVCLQPKLAIEIDGGQHAVKIEDDLRKTKYLEAVGYRVIRFWNHEVLAQPQTVLEAIRLTLKEPPLTLALSRREREKAGGDRSARGYPTGEPAGPVSRFCLSHGNIARTARCAPFSEKQKTGRTEIRVSVIRVSGDGEHNRPESQCGRDGRRD